MSSPTDPNRPRRDDGDSGRIPAPTWFLRELLARAAELLEESDAPSGDFDARRAKWREVYEEVKRNG